MTAGITELGRRVLWFLGLWLAGVAAVGVLALLIRTALFGAR